MAQSEQQMLTTRKSLIGWYRDQLAKFHKLGIGKFTENNTKISQTLIDTTMKRIVQLGGTDALHPDWGTVKIEIEPSENNSTERVRLFRERQQVKAKLREMLNDNHTNGTASATRSKSNGNNGHDRGKS